MSKVLVGLDIGASKIIAASADENGHIIKRERAATPLPLDKGLALIDDMIHAVTEGAQIAGIGAAVAGPLDSVSGVVSPLHLPEWRDIPLKRIMETRYLCRFTVDVDCNLAALAEYHHAAEKPSRMLYLTISTGLGGGFIIDGEIYRGMNGWHPEVGHHSVPYRLNHRRTVACPCGSNGCLEALVSASGIKRLYRKQPEDLSADEWEEVAFNLGQGLRNLAVIYLPNVIIVGGSVAFGARESLLNPAAQIMRDHLKIVPHPRVCASELGEHNILNGAIHLALRNI